APCGPGSAPPAGDADHCGRSSVGSGRAAPPVPLRIPTTRFLGFLRGLGDGLRDLLGRRLTRDQRGHAVVHLVADLRRERLVEVELEAGRARQDLAELPEVRVLEGLLGAL